MQNPIGKLFVMSAPSGAGKSTLAHAIVEKMAGTLERVKTYTTKAPSGTQADAEYHFVSAARFTELITQGFFMEWSTAYGTYYGSPRSVLSGLALGKSYILILDRSGAQAVKELWPEACLLWIYTSSLATLAQRLQQRGRDAQEHIARRLEIAQAEVAQESNQRLYTYHIANDELKLALQELEKTICAELFGSKMEAKLYGLAAQDRA